MRFRHLIVLIVATVALAPAAAAQAQEISKDGRLAADHILDWERVDDPQISPDGAQVIYARSLVNTMDDSWESQLWIMNADGSKHRFLVKGSDSRWSPDGTRIAYTAEGEPTGTQIFVRWMDAEGATSQVSRLDESPSGVRWSPDGEQIAFTMIDPQKETWDIDMPSPPEGADWTAPPRIVRRTHFRRDRQGFVKDGHDHLFVIPADGGTARQLTEGAWLVASGGFSWVADSGAIVFSGLRNEDFDRMYRESHIYKVDLESGAIDQITQRRGPWGVPKVSPDGRKVAYTGFDWTSQTYRVTDLYVANLDGTGEQNLSAALDRDARPLVWSSDSRRIYFNVGSEGSRNIYAASIDIDAGGGGAVTPLTEGVHMLTLSSVSDAGVGVAVRTSPQVPPDIVRVDLAQGAEITQLTHVNDDVLVGIELGDVEEVWYDSTGGTRVQGWIIKPPEFDAGRSYPLILHIHGGPHGMYNVGFNQSFQSFAAQDFVVLYTNPRGSTGYGTDFGNAIDNGYPSVDHDDLMAGVDAVLERGYVDPNRLYVTGCSGGGVLSSWAIGQTDRFAAAAVRCPVTNWMSFAGTTDITVWGYYRYAGYPWDNPNKYLEHSPIMYVGNVTTPTLLMTGELDLRTPMSQTEEYYQALRTLGVPTTLLRFNKEYHGTGSLPSNFIRRQLYIVDWFNQYRKGATETSAQ